MKINIACLVIALTALACTSEPPGPGPDPTQPPIEITTTPVIQPAETPVPFVPCVAVPPSPGIYKGDCEVNDDCRTNADGTYSGKCHTRTS